MCESTVAAVGGIVAFIVCLTLVCAVIATIVNSGTDNAIRDLTQSGVKAIMAIFVATLVSLGAVIGFINGIEWAITAVCY